MCFLLETAYNSMSFLEFAISCYNHIMGSILLQVNLDRMQIFSLPIRGLFSLPRVAPAFQA